MDLTKEYQLSSRDYSASEDLIVDHILDYEQKALDNIYSRLDDMRSLAQHRKQKNLQEISHDDPQALSERDSYDQLYTDDIARYDAAEHSLYFGQLVMNGGDILRIGRIGVLDDDDDLTTLLLDWRAPLARPFYFATPAQPENVLIRRHVTTSGRKIIRYTNEILSADEFSDNIDINLDSSIIGEAALISALQQARTGTMNDIVSTIQREQDIIIRSDHKGILVVQGGPGTGKTAVALHRAAYLMYTHRSTLERSGVLIIGPNSTFLDYVSQVLPSLGENGVMLSTIGDLFPGVKATLTDSSVVRQIKGNLTMVPILKALVTSWQRVPKQSVAYNFENTRLIISDKIILNARAKARGSKKPHNEASQMFRQIVVDNLTKQYIAHIGKDDFSQANLLTKEDLTQIRSQLHNEPQLNSLLDKFWPQLTPQFVLREFFTNPKRIDITAKELSPEHKAALYREKITGFSPDDAPLLDELAELLGTIAPQETTLKEQEQKEKITQAQRVLDTLANSTPQDHDDTLMAHDLLNAQQLADRDNDKIFTSVAARAANDRSWVFGHVIVDEAQELSPMAWRMVLRRIPNRWMTVVGDTAQTSEPAGITEWGQAFTPYVNNRWRLAELTINYRTPEEIARLAANVLHELDPQATIPKAIRKSGFIPEIISANIAEQPHIADKIYQDYLREGKGIIAFIIPDDRITEFSMINSDALYTVKKSKGLEFDHVVLLEPTRIIEQSDHGLNDLYVALTRSTTKLTIIHDALLPKFLVDQ